MHKKMKLKAKIFKGKTSNEVEEMANEWASKFIREEKSLRVSYNDRNGDFIVECTCVEEELEVM